MPEATLNAVKMSGVFSGDTITPSIKSAKVKLAKIAIAGIDIAKVTDTLEIEGIAKFQAAWLGLMSSVKSVISGS